MANDDNILGGGFDDDFDMLDDKSSKLNDSLNQTRKQMQAANLSQEEMNKLLAAEEAQLEKIVQVRGTELKQVKDLSTLYDSIYTNMQDQTNTVEQLYGVQNKLADKLQLQASLTLEIAAHKRETRDMSLEEANINARTRGDLQELNRLKISAISHAQKLTLFNKENIPYYDQMQKIQAEIAVLSQRVGDNVDSENAHRLKTLQHMKKEYETLGKLEKRNDRIAEMQSSINDLMTMQGTAAGEIFSTLKSIVTNPLLIFTGLLALGVQRFETMRGRSNDLAEEMDRVNKKLAGAGPYQDAIISRARKIHSTFRAAGEGFSSSLESAVDAVQSLQKQLGNINYVTSDLVDIMTDLKLSINLGDDQVAKVINTYLSIDGLSEKAAINSAEMLYSMSEQIGLNPADTFREIANATGETLAHFKGGGIELNKAVISAKRMGLGLEDVAKISRGLLDFETSIEAEMEAQMLTGMNLNFNKARMFAMNKEGAKAAEEVMRQVGGLERFRRMNVFQQEAVARATGLSVNELLKSNVQREREAKIAKEKQQIHKDTVKMLPVVTSVMGKLDTGLGVIEKISRILGDIVLDVFGVDFKEAEKLILRFVNSDTFTTGLKNVLFFMKGVMEGIKSAIVTIWDVLKNMPWIGDFLKNMGSQDMSGGYGGSEKGGKFIGKALAYGYMAKTLLGATPLTAMWVQSAGGALKGLGKGIFNGVKGLFGGGGGAAAGGSLPGQMSMFPELVPHGAGVGGGGMMAGMSGAQMAGYGAAAGFIAKGAYNVLSLDNKNTSGEAAGAVGSLLGAAGGAKAGAAIGTIFGPLGTAAGAAIGAGVGYFGGLMVKHIDYFKDDLDRARDGILKAEKNLLHKNTMNDAKLRMKQVEASNKVRYSFEQLGLTTDGITQNELRSFAQAQLDAGNITKDQFTAGLKGEILPLKLLELASQGAAGALGLEDQARKKWVEDQMLTSDVENYNNIQLLKQKLVTVQSLTDDMLDEKITKSYLKQNDGTPSAKVFAGVFTDEDMDKAAKMLYNTYDGAVDMEDINEAVKNLSYVSGMYATKTDAMEKAMESVKDELESGLNTKLSEAELKHRTTELSLLKKSQQMKYDPKTGGLVVTVKDPNSTDTKAVGGLLEGPSHAQGGIQTKFGEMEGGEAVINKKSTSKYMGVLSRINQDQGGVAFEQGGVTGKYEMGGRTVDGVSGASGGSKNTYTVNLTKYKNAREMGDLTSTPSHGMWPGHIQSRMVNPERAVDFGYPPPIDGDPTKYFVDPWDYGNRDTYANRDKTGRGIDTQSLELNRNQMKHYLEVAQTVLPSKNTTIGSTGYNWLDSIVSDEGYNFTNQNCADFNARAFGVDPGDATEGQLGTWGGVTTPEMAFPLILEKYGALNKRKSVGDMNKGSLNSFLKGNMGDFTGLWDSKTGMKDLGSSINQGFSDAASGASELVSSGADNIVKKSSDWTGGVIDLNQSPKKAWENTKAYWGFEDGGVTSRSPVSENQNQYFRDIPVTKVNDMIMTKDGQMIETSPDDNIIAKKGGITQNKGNSSSGGSSSSKEMINLLRELIIVNKNAKIKLNSSALADTVNTANYING